ncbi:MAG: hypothetical protein Q4D29_02780 [Lachnospiraceae bacterium]|nr:hypothetical protein [Lachnospiraceae bacterium]
MNENKTPKNTILKTTVTIIIAFVIFFAIVALKLNSSRLFSSKVGVTAVKNMKEVDTLFVGASSFRKGLNMHTIDDSLNGSSYMLTYNGNQPMNMDLEIKELFNSGVKINTLVMEFDPGMISSGPDLSDKRLLWDIGFKSQYDLWKLLSTREDADFFMCYDYWVSSNIDYFATYFISAPVIAKRYYLGGNTGEDDVKGLSADELDALDVIEAPGFSDLQKSSLQDIINLCKANNTKLICIESPNYKKMYEDLNYAEKTSLLKEFLLENDIETITKDELSFDYTNPAYYSDLSHMSSEGMNVYTKEIIDLLNR